MANHCCVNWRTTNMLLQVVCIILVITGVVSGFNLDTVNFLSYRGPRNTMFGFAVAAHRERESSWVLVGAPTAQTNQPGVVRGGAVFRCHVTWDKCEQVEFDTSGNNLNTSKSEIDQKSNQWFGATLYSSGDGSAVVACAPRYIYKPVVTIPREDPVGACYVARNQFKSFAEYAPCRTSDWGYHRQGSCQAGLGASISRDGRYLYIGAPGSRYWQGTLYLLPSSIHDSPVWPFPGQIYSQNLYQRPEVYSTGEGPASDDDSYLGYSVAVGDFAGDGTSSVAVGRPRGGQLVGKVLIYTWNLTQMYVIPGEQLGGYFGYSLCAADLDGDGLDDLVVGSPLYSDLHNNEGKYETGRIYVFYQNEEYEKNHTRDGTNSKARFGLSLARLGDINMDGYEDIAVGAPYDGPGERGAVYIYMGSKEGIMEKFSQVLYAATFSDTLTTFGFSVGSGGVDMDSNEYPDLVIGAYESDFAFLLRARPVVKIKAALNFTSASKLITLENPNCNVRNGLPAICTSLNMSLEYHGVGTDRTLEVEVKIVLDSAKPRNPRMFFRRNERRSSLTFPLTLEKNYVYRENVEVFIEANVRDKLTPLVAEMTYNLKTRDDSQSAYRSAKNVERIRRQLRPILDMAHDLTEKDSLDIFKDCGQDNICIPDLRVVSDSRVKTYLLGSGEQFELDVDVHNRGDDAFEATYYLKIPRGLSYININRTEEDRRSGVPVLCLPPTNKTQNILKCDIGNPLPKNKHVGFTVLMQPFYTEGLKSQYEFVMLVNSTNPEKNSSLVDNVYSLEVPISIRTDFEIMGASEPHEVYWSAANYTKEKFTHEDDVGPPLTYIHVIQNKGPADIVEANVFFMIPNETLTGDTILYLLEQPVTSGPIKCQPVDANPLHLMLERKDGVTYTENWRESSSLSGDRTSQSGSEDKFPSSEHKGVSSETTNRGTGGGSVSGGTGSSVRNEGAWAEQGGSRHVYGLRGETDGGRVLHRDEGLISSTDGVYGQGVQTSHGTQYFQNSSTWTNRTEFHSGNEGDKTYSSSHFNSSWSENNGPTHYFSNYSSSDSDGADDNGRRGHQNGRIHDNTHSVPESGSGGGKIVYNITTTHHSSQSSEGASGSSGGYRHQDEDNRGHGSSDPHGTFRHYSTEWSGGNEGGKHGGSSGSAQWSESENVIGTDNIDNTQHSEEDGQYGNLGHSKIRHRYNSNSGDNIDETYHRGSSGLGDYNQNVRTGTYEHTADNSNYGEADGHLIRHSASRGNYGDGGSSRTNVFHGTSDSWESTNYDDSGNRGSDTNSGYSSSRHYTSGSNSKHWERGHENSGDSTRKYSTPFNWNGDNPGIHQYEDVDLSYAATGEHTSSGNSQHHGSERHYSDGEQHRPGTNDYDRRDEQSSETSWQSTYSSSSHDNDDEARLKLYRRFRREVAEGALEDLLQCNATKCMRISCVMGPLLKGQDVRVELRTRVWVPTLKKLSSNNRVVKTSSLMAYEVTRLPYIGTPHEPMIRGNEVFTDINLTDSPVKPEVVPLWVVVLSAVAGAIILLLIIYLLWMCGFFKRNRPSDSAEKEPLNRNGHYATGDEAL